MPELSGIQDMFRDCVNLTGDINFPNTWHCYHMENTFMNCNNLTDIITINMQQCVNMWNIIYGCDNIKTSGLCNLINDLQEAWQVENPGNQVLDLRFIGMSNTQINNLPESALIIAREKGWNC